MITCPKCSMSLPDGAGSCQFCKAVWAPNAAQGGGRAPRPRVFGEPEGWVVKAYNGIAAWWLLSGIWSIIHATALATDKDNGGGSLAILFGAITALIGLGLLLRIESARKVVTFVCFVSILAGVIGILFGFFFDPVSTLWGIIGLLADILDIGLAGLMIYVIGETDRAPNF